MGSSGVLTAASDGEAMCIFFLTFKSIHLIKGTQARALTSGAYFDVKGESNDEIRNQEESGPEEESCC